MYKTPWHQNEVLENKAKTDVNYTSAYHEVSVKLKLFTTSAKYQHQS